MWVLCTPCLRLKAYTATSPGTFQWVCFPCLLSRSLSLFWRLLALRSKVRTLSTVSVVFDCIIFLSCSNVFDALSCEDRLTAGGCENSSRGSGIPIIIVASLLGLTLSHYTGHSGCHLTTALATTLFCHSLLKKIFTYCRSPQHR